MKKVLAFIIIVLVQWVVPGGAQETERETERIREEIEVVNVEVPVRVFYKKKPVKGLKKKDFKLFIDKEEREINGFYEVRKKIDTPPARRKPRLYVLMFNVMTYTDEVAKGLEKLFGKVIRPRDRIMVLTNTMFLKDKVVADPKADLEKLKKILRLESKKVEKTINTLEYNLRYMASSFKMDYRTPGLAPDRLTLIVQRFIDDYGTLLEEFKQAFFNPRHDQYLMVADYLKSQKVDKWVLNFYQESEFPMLEPSKSAPGLYRMIEVFALMADMENPYLHRVEYPLGRPNRAYVETVGKLFLNTGATFHTLLMDPHLPEFYKDFRYTAVSIDSEHISRKVTRLTGGSIVDSNNMEKFIKKISGKEDVYYMLTYAPKTDAGKGKVRIRMPGKGFRVVYDDRQRPRYMKRAVTAMEKAVPQIRFQKVELKDGLIYAFISGVRLEGKKEGAQKGKLLLGIKILNDQVQEAAVTKKGFTCWAETVPVRLRLPALKKGKYQVVLEVNDVLSGKNDVELRDIVFEEDIVLGPGEVAFRFIASSGPGEADGSGGIARDSGLERRLKEDVDPSFSKEGMDPGVLPRILENVAGYCDRLRATSLNFFCIEEIDETVFKSLEWRGKSRKEENRYVYGYQLVKDSGAAREKRALFEVNGREELRDNVKLGSRFKYEKIVYGPLIFNRGSQERYRYEIVGKKEWKGKGVYIVEAVPKAAGVRGAVSGRFWVDEGDFSILRIETYQRSLVNFGDIERLAGVHRLAPWITIINEYEIVKKGVRFPSKLYYEEAYKDKRGRMVVQALGNITFKDYQFFSIVSRVTKEER